MIEIKDTLILERIEKDKKHFQETIGGEDWSDEDVLKEWIKILDTVKQDGKE